MKTPILQEWAASSRLNRYLRELSASLRELSGNRIKYFRSGLIPEREVSPACCSALEGWWTFRKWKTARCKFLETVRRFLSEPDKRRHGAKAY
jgi:hypothetical protein